MLFFLSFVSGAFFTNQKVNALSLLLEAQELEQVRKKCREASEEAGGDPAELGFL